jgi:PRTRC genetic system protein E
MSHGSPYRDVSVQAAFPELGKEEREFLISGTSPEGWQEPYGSAEDSIRRTTMFHELMPLLKERTVMLTLSRVDDTTIRVCVIPKLVKSDSKESTGENALCTPLTVTGTVDELEREFAAQLSGYSTAVVKLGSNLAELEAEHAVAIKTVKEEKKKELDQQRGKASASKATSTAASGKPGPVMKDGKPVFGSKDGQATTASSTLFEPAAGTARPEQQAPITPSVAANAETGESEGGRPPTSTAKHSTGETASTEGQAAFSYPD